MAVRYNPGLYASYQGFAWDGRLGQFFDGIFFLGEFWSDAVMIGSNGPYWSLTYEVWYYVAFGAILFAPRCWKIPAACAFLLLVGPKIALMWPIWLLGVLAYRITRTQRIGPVAGYALWLGSAAAWIGYEAWAWSLGRPWAPASASFHDDYLRQDYLVGVLFAVNLVGFAAIAPQFARVTAMVARPIRWAAGATFTLYIIHTPLLLFFAAVSPFRPASLAQRALLVVGTFAVVLAFAAVTERRKDLWRSALARAVAPLGVRPAAP